MTNVVGLAPVILMGKTSKKKKKQQRKKTNVAADDGKLKEAVKLNLENGTQELERMQAMLDIVCVHIYIIDCPSMFWYGKLVVLQAAKYFFWVGR